jgi:hypothetical protein
MKRERTSGAEGRPRCRLKAFLLSPVLAACLLAPGASGAETPAVRPGMELVFAGQTARVLGDDVAVPVMCVGEQRGICSGVLTLSRAGRKASVAYSVGGGAQDSLFLRFRLDPSSGQPAMVSAIASTDQGLGAPTRTEALLRAR